MVMSFLGFGIGMLFFNVHMCGMMLLFSALLYMLVRYASPSSPICFRSMMFTLSGPVEMLFLLCFIGLVLW